MATFSGLHIECSRFGVDRDQITAQHPCIWSETFTSANMTTSVGPDVGGPESGGEPCVTVSAGGGDWMVVVGLNPPDPTLASTPRHLIRDGADKTIKIPPGHKVRAAPVS